MRKYKYSLTAALLLLFILLLPGVLSFGIKYIPDSVQPELTYVYPIFGNQTVTQHFKAVDNNLSGVGMTVKNPSLRNSKELLLELSEERDDNKIRVISRLGTTIQDGNFVQFNFNPIALSKNKQYVLKISSFESGADDALEIFLTNKPYQNLGVLIKDEKEASDSAISMVSFYKPDSPFTIGKLVYQNLIAKLLSDSFFSFFYLFLIIIFFSYLISLEKRSSN